MLENVTYLVWTDKIREFLQIYFKICFTDTIIRRKNISIAF